MADELVAVVGGQAWANWTSYRVDRDILTPADGWQLSVGNPTAAQVAAIQEGSAIALSIGATPLLRGWVDTKQLSRSRDGTRLVLNGRDQVAPLVDCSATTQLISGTTVAAAAQKALQSLGIAARVDADAAATTPVRVAVEPGETFWDVLERLAKAAGVMVWAEPGVLRIGRPDYVSAPVASLVLSDTPLRSNIVSIEHSWNVSGRRSTVQVGGQGGGSDTLFGATSSSVRGTATDAELVAMGLVRPLILSDADASSASAARARAEWEVSRRQGEAWTATVGLRGNGPSPGQVWTPNTVVTLDDDRAGVHGPHWISAVSLSGSRDQGTRTALTLRRLGAILPAPV